ncbi:MAG: hypothetical protein H6937_09500 [Burkholderiales bacterium]|nr:hypothetical protein [Burkholderiales bacterium]
MEQKNFRGLNFCTSKAALAAGTTTTFSTTGATLYSINGKAKSTAAGTNAATPTTDANTGAAFLPVPANKACIFVFCYDGDAAAADAINVIQGEMVDLDGAADGANAILERGLDFPHIPDTLTPIGYLITRVGASGSAWTFGSSNLAGPPSNVKHDFVDVMVLPNEPVTP